MSQKWPLTLRFTNQSTASIYHFTLYTIYPSHVILLNLIALIIHTSTVHNIKHAITLFSQVLSYFISPRSK